MIKRAFALTSCLLVAACAPAAIPASPTPIASASITGAPSAAPSASPRAAQPLLRGQVVSMNADRDMVTFFADRGSLFARSTRDGPAPYLSKIQRAEPSGTWRTVIENDAAFFAEKVMSGRMALVEYREEPLSAGAYDVTVVLIDPH